MPRYRRGRGGCELSELADGLEAAVEARDVGLVAELAADQDAAFNRMKAGEGPQPILGEMERLRDLIDRAVHLLADAAQDTAAELEAVRAWRRCLRRYRPQDLVGARFVDRRG